MLPPLSLLWVLHPVGLPVVLTEQVLQLRGQGHVGGVGHGQHEEGGGGLEVYPEGGQGGADFLCAADPECVDVGDAEPSWLDPPRCVDQGGFCLLWCLGSSVGEQGLDVQLSAGHLLHEVEQQTLSNQNQSI